MVRNYKRKRQDTYNKEDLQSAVRAVRNGVSGYKAASLYQIPRMTIMDHVHGKRLSNKPGRKSALSLDEEQKIASCLHIMERHGFGMGREEIAQVVGEYVKKNNLSTCFRNGIPGKDWLAGFQIRQNLTVKKPQAVEYARKVAVDPFLVYGYYELLNKTVTELGLQNKPDAIWNLDETSFSKDPSKTKIVGLKGHAATRTISTPGRDNTTVLLGASAAGEKTPPLIVFKGKYVWDEWTSPDAYPGTTYAATKNGWMESDVFEAFFKKSFLPTVGDQRPVLLIYDGHATHVALNIIEAARNEKITILKLPPHSSHILQPLDISVMKSFKDRWDVALVKYQRLNVGVALPKKEFSRLIGKIWAEIPSEILHNGFRKAGIYPFNPKAIEESKFDALKLNRWKEQKTSTVIEKDPKAISPTVNQQQTSATSSTKKLPLKLVSIVLTFINENMTADDQAECRNLIMTTNSNHSPIKPRQATEERIKTTFEELLLEKLKRGDTSIKGKRCRVAPGAEVITHDDVVKSKIDKQIKNIKQENKIQKRKDKENNIKTSSPKNETQVKNNKPKIKNQNVNDVTLLSQIHKSNTEVQAFIATDNENLPTCLQNQIPGSSEIKILSNILVEKSAVSRDYGLLTQPGPSGVQNSQGKRKITHSFAASIIIDKMRSGKENEVPFNQDGEGENNTKNKGVGKKSKAKEKKVPSKQDREDENKIKNKGIGKKSNAKENKVPSKQDREDENKIKSKGVGKKRNAKKKKVTSKRIKEDGKCIKKYDALSLSSTSVSGKISSHSDSDIAEIESDYELSNYYSSFVASNKENVYCDPIPSTSGYCAKQKRMIKEEINDISDLQNLSFDLDITTIPLDDEDKIICKEIINEDYPIECDVVETALDNTKSHEREKLDKNVEGTSKLHDEQKINSDDVAMGIDLAIRKEHVHEDDNRTDKSDVNFTNIIFNETAKKDDDIETDEPNKLEISLSVNDSVLVRYYEKKKWVYYIGFVESVEFLKETEQHYTIRYLKTVKNPVLKFVTKKLDRDVVPAGCIVKRVHLNFESGKYMLSNKEDHVYF